MATPRRQATPVELAGVLMDAVCAPVDAEQRVLEHLATVLDLDLGRLQTELLYLKAFAADFAISMALGRGPAREAVLQRYYRHWESIGSEVEDRVSQDLQERLRLYTEAVGEPNPQAAGLQEVLGQTFSRCCGAGSATPQLVVLGGAMFGALFTGISDLLDDVEVVLPAGGSP